jgi:hypothetical protein
MSNLLDNPDWWRKRAEEARIIADSMRNAEGKRMMCEVAASYEELARRAEARRTGSGLRAEARQG